MSTTKKPGKKKRPPKAAGWIPPNLPAPGADGYNQLDGDGSEERVRRMYQTWEKETSKRRKPKAGKRQ